MTTTVSTDEAEIAGAARALDGAEPEGILRWALERFSPDLGLACSFGGLEGMVLLDMTSRLGGSPKVFVLDTDLLFPETYELLVRAQERYGIDPIRVRPELTLAEQAARHGEELWRRDPDLCCRLRKVEPFARFFREANLAAWMTGLRNGQAATRTRVPIVQWDVKFGLVKANPLARWSLDQVRAYVREHDVPVNPLHERGYPSVGCRPCTRPVSAGADPRSGRWAGFAKTECGLHQ